MKLLLFLIIFTRVFLSVQEDEERIAVKGRIVAGLGWNCGTQDLRF